MSNPWKYGFVGLLALQGIGAFFYFNIQSHGQRLFDSFLLTPITHYPVFSPINSTQHLDVTASSKINKHFEVAQQKNITCDRNVSQFVSFHNTTYAGRRLGNQLFDFAAVVFAAELTGRRPVLNNTTQRLTIEKVFQLNLERVDHDLCPCYTIREARYMTYDEITEKQIQKAGNNSMLICGFRQSWKYTMTIEHRLRRHLVFTDEIQRFAEDFLKRNIPRGWKKVGFVRVGIHARRGDTTKERLVTYGFTVANATYFEKAMRFFIARYSRIQFIAMSEDSSWIKENIVIPKNLSSTVSVNVTYSLGHSAGQDLAILSLCDHVIMSTGTYGWWGAWLAKGTTIYYEDWPRLGSKLYGHFTKEDFFPPSWIPMT